LELTLEQAMKVPEKVAVDFETTGLRWWEDTPLTMGLATNEKLGYVDLRKYSKEALSRFFHDFLTTHKTIYHNAKFDLHIIDWSYLALTGLKFDFACSLILSQIWDERIPHDLDYLSETFLGVDYLRDKRAVNDYIKEHKLKDWSQVPFHLLAARGVEDARNTYLLYDFIRPMVSETKVYQLEKELTMTLLLMERNGIQIDKPYL
jgi:DNA polymerase I-like protein with 3'-5' exonuclease and polymerase domains